MIKKVSLLVFILLNCNILFSQESIKVLFIGNSLTYCNDLPGMVGQLAQNEEKDIYIDQVTLSGATLRYLSTSSKVIDKINELPWDYIVLQSDDITAFSDMYDIEIQTINDFKNIIYNNNEATKIIYEMVWGFENGVSITGEGFYSYEQYINKIYNGTIFIANAHNILIAPVGWAWKKARELQPEISLFASDEMHPGLLGSYLGACVFYNVIFVDSLRNNNYINSIENNQAQFLQDVANEVVTNNYKLWNLDSLNINTGIALPSGKKDVVIYPNPFIDDLTIKVSLPKLSQIHCEIFDLCGRKIKELINSNSSVGEIYLKWDGCNDNGIKVKKGVYFVQLKVNSEFISRKVVCTY